MPHRVACHAAGKSEEQIGKGFFSRLPDSSRLKDFLRKAPQEDSQVIQIRIEQRHDEERQYRRR